MKSYLVEIKDYNNDVSRYIDVIADSKSSARRFAEKATKVRHNLGETVGKALEKALELIDACVIDGLVYATYEDGLILKDLIWAYNARH